MPILEFKNVSKLYDGKTKAIDDLNFKIEEGEFVSIIGPSGAGKSTLLRCINRLVDASVGEIVFDGIEVVQAKGSQLREVRTKSGMIFQHYNLVDRSSVFENVLHGTLGRKGVLAGMLGLYTEEEKLRALEIIEELGLSDQTYKRCDELSGGQKQRVGIARAIMQDPRLLLCDEPIASLDPKSSKVIMDRLYNINKNRRITCIVNLHQVEVARQYSERILGVSDGKIVFDCKPEELTQDIINTIYKSQSDELIMDLSEVGNAA
ncbi:MAG: phosphonate ABC transporter ATP-binding protein [Erysipelotrichaceae bacterium]|nr:phosphonate ABC transporter ATP-binding protein [Erysipelotrichaceae bacterium]